MNPGIAPREPGQKILIFNIIYRDVEMFETPGKWIIRFKLPFEH
jgi:hypothetical protein